jgi:hypothetical protein
MLDRLVVDALGPEIVADESVSSSSLRQQLGAGERKPLVVEKAGSPEDSERLSSLRSCKPGAPKPLVQAPFRERTRT